MESCDEGEVSILLDSELRIVGADKRWDLRADDFGAVHLLSESLQGSNILNHCSGAFTKRFYRRLFESVLSGGEPKVVPYRCDAPDRKRFMDMVVETDAGGLRCTHRTLEVVPRVTGEATMSLVPLQTCSICLRVAQKQQWHDPLEDAQWISRVDWSRTVFTVCPDCAERKVHSAVLAGSCAS